MDGVNGRASESALIGRDAAKVVGLLAKAGGLVLILLIPPFGGDVERPGHGRVGGCVDMGDEEREDA